MNKSMNNLDTNGEGDAKAGETEFGKAEWFVEAATQGHCGAQNNLGWCYANGEGVAQDEAKAAEWFAKAATQSLTAQIRNESSEAIGMRFLEDAIEDRHEDRHEERRVDAIDGKPYTEKQFEAFYGKRNYRPVWAASRVE